MSPDDPQPRLQVTDAEGTHIHPLTRFPFTLGRSAACDLCIANAQVSRQHAAIEQGGEGLCLRDLGSRHGTQLNGRPVTSAKLQPGDRITLGNGTATLLFLEGSSASATPSGARALPHESIGDTARDLLTRVSSQSSGSDLEKLSLFLEAAQRFSGTQVLEEVLNTTIEYTLRLTCAERGFVFLGSDVATLRLRTGRSSDGSILHDDSAISRSIIRDAAQSGLDYILGDATATGAAIGRESIIVHDLRSVIAMPLRRRNSGTLLGLLYLDSRLQS